MLVSWLFHCVIQSLGIRKSHAELIWLCGTLDNEQWENLYWRRYFQNWENVILRRYEIFHYRCHQHYLLDCMEQSNQQLQWLLQDMQRSQSDCWWAEHEKGCIILDKTECYDFIARHVSSFQLTNSKGLFYLYYEKRIVRSKEHYFYSGVSLFAEIGGYLGLLLGISFLNFASWFSELIKSRISSRKTYNHHTANMQSNKWFGDKTGGMTPVEWERIKEASVWRVQKNPIGRIHCEW